MGRASSLREQQTAMFGLDPLDVIRTAIADYGDDVIVRVAMLSGGDDSTTLTHWLWTHALDGTFLPADRPELDEQRIAQMALHIDTGIGLRETRAFVSRFCHQLRIPLRIESAPPGEYERAVLRWGFPGPAMHGTMYDRLKGRALARFIAQTKEGHPRQAKVMLLGGARRSESARRMGTAEPVSGQGAERWVAPFVDWIRADLEDWRRAHDVPRSDVAALLHLSGECLCGAMSKPDERVNLKWAAPQMLGRIEQLERKADFYGVERSRWGERRPGERSSGHSGPMCSTCEQAQALFDAGDGACALAARKQIEVFGYGTARPEQLTCRIATPGREPGPTALVHHGAPWVSIGRRITLGGTVVAEQLLDGLPVDYRADRPGAPWPQGVLVGAADQPDADSESQRLAAEHHGAIQSALDITCPPAPGTGRGRRTKGARKATNDGLCVYALSSPDAPGALECGPVRLGNYDRRVAFDRVRIIRRRALLDEAPAAAYDQDPHSGTWGWTVQGVGRFSHLVVCRYADQRRLERAWREHGISAGAVDTHTATDLHEPLTRRPRHGGARTLARLSAGERAAAAGALRAIAERRCPSVAWTDERHARVRRALAHVGLDEPEAFLRAAARAIEDENARDFGVALIHPDDLGEDWAPPRVTTAALAA